MFVALLINLTQIRSYYIPQRLPMVKYQRWRERIAGEVKQARGIRYRKTYSAQNDLLVYLIVLEQPALNIKCCFGARCK